MDDEPLNLFVMNELLKEQNIDCDQAQSGQKAVELVQRRCELVVVEAANMYKIIFLDYSMDGMDGPDVAIKIRRLVQEANLCQPIICCCTAYSEVTFE